MNLEFNKRIKNKLEETSLQSFDREIDLSSNSYYGTSSDGVGNKINCLCSTNSTMFVFIEQNAMLLSINLNKLAYSSNFSIESKKIVDTHKSYSLNDCIQKLNITALPIGNLNKILINNNGTHILLVYDKSLSAVELPMKFGKFNEYDDGSSRIICKTIEFQLKNITNVIDAVWHSPPDDDFILCLTNIGHNTVLKLFSLSNHNVVLKTFNLSGSLIGNQFLSTQLEKTDLKLQQKSGDRFVGVEIGARFEYNEKFAYPIFILKANGSVHCLIEYENSKNFNYLGQLTIDPYCMDYDSEQILDFICLPNQPNCIVLLLNTGVLHHCIFIPNTRSFAGVVAGSGTGVGGPADMTTNTLFESTNFYDDVNGEFNTDAVLFVYESIQLNANGIFNDVKLVKDQTDSFRYYIYHNSGVHSVYLPWLESTKKSISNIENFDATDYSDTKLSEISYLICTKPIQDNSSNSTIAGVTTVFGHDARTMLVALKKDSTFICSNIYKSVQYDLEKRYGRDRTKPYDSFSGDTSNDRFIEYIKGILKRDFTLPIIKSDTASTANKDNDEFIVKVINSLKAEYLEKQKQAFNELIKRSKLLKQQAYLEKEKILEINNNIDKLNQNRLKIETKFVDVSERQNVFTETLKDLSLKLNKNMSTVSESEIKLSKELKSMKETLKTFDKQIKDFKSLGEFDGKTDMSKELKEFKYNEEDMKIMKNLMKNEATKIKDITQRIEKLRLAVDM